MTRRLKLIVFCSVFALFLRTADAQNLTQVLQAESAADQAADARQNGNPQRGAILFHQVHVGCIKCHAVDGTTNSLGPDLTKLSEQKDATDDYVMTSVLEPSRVIRKGYETILVQTIDGKATTGLLVDRNNERTILRDPLQQGTQIVIPSDRIENQRLQELSIMPAGVIDQIGSRQQFLDLMSYVFELRDGGVKRARELQPPPGLVTLTVPEYEQHVDHAGLLKSLDDQAFERGAAIYNRLCINCHGDLDQPGSLPTALRFAEGKFKNGSDPHSMYRTLTYGSGLMVPQTWMVPRQKYDVIHYIRETYLKDRNPSQFLTVDGNYLASLPKGDTLGPDPVPYAPWSDMNYGPSMVNTFEIGSDGTNFAYKGIAVRLDAGPGGVSQGNKWAIFDHDTMRIAAVWRRDTQSQEPGFINWQGIHFDGRHGTHPRIVGEELFENPTGPGWAHPETGSFDDHERVIGRDDRRYGPLPKHWAEYHGFHVAGQETIVDYSIDQTRILEQFHSTTVPLPANSVAEVFERQLHFGTQQRELINLVATHSETDLRLESVGDHAVALIPDVTTPRQVQASEFDGNTYYLVDGGSSFDMASQDFTITARIRTDHGGTIFAKAPEDGPWVPDGTTFFVRGGKLGYDIGWVGAVQSKKSVADGTWHNVAMSWEKKTGQVRFFVDGKPSGGGELVPKDRALELVAKIGFTNGNFPSESFFDGEISHVAFYQAALSADVVGELTKSPGFTQNATAAWDLSGHVTTDQKISNTLSDGLHLTRITGDGTSSSRKMILSGVIGETSGVKFQRRAAQLCLAVGAAANPRDLLIWTTSVDATTPVDQLSEIVKRIEDQCQVRSLPEQFEQVRTPRWPEIITTSPVVGPEDEAFAIDFLTSPMNNPWLCRIRLTGHDFFSNGDEVAVCSWDGDVWLVRGLKTLSGDHLPQLTWQRIASGLFQPLGVKIVDDVVYVTCRDQIVILRDLNGDRETDFYECFNDDHQVTDHFHEFAMGLQRDADGNFYYAKSARHALTALVPHHGTLLKVSPDGETTTIIANGFRAANGVCLNPDGSFIVTDQEGHWNPKNRINWVTEGGFYGNMFGYHNVTDDSDEAMIPPLCWITNAFDRSPSELLWVDSASWGSLNGKLLNLSYGYGKVYIVPHENIDGQMQGGMCEFPIPQFPTGTCRGRFHTDGALYLSGMFAWGSNQQSQEGGFYRLRKTKSPAYLPIGLNAQPGRMVIELSDPVDPKSVENLENFEIQTWDLKRSANYGSDHYNQQTRTLTGASLSPDGTKMTLEVPSLEPTWGMEIRCRLTGQDGSTFERVIHNTIHKLAPVPN